MAVVKFNNDLNKTQDYQENLSDFVEFRDYYRTVSTGLNASICSAYPNTTDIESSLGSIDDTFLSCTSFDETLKPGEGNRTDEIKRHRKRARSLDESIIFVDEYIPDIDDKTGKEIKHESTGLKKLLTSVIVLPKTSKRKRRLSDCTDDGGDADDYVHLKKYRYDDEIGDGPSKKSTANWDIFSRSERKKNDVYNMNIFNPNRRAILLSNGRKRMVILDGSNIAFHHALGREFSVKGLDIAIKYFENLGHDVKAIVPQFRLQRYRSTDPASLEYLNRIGKIVFTPCKNLPGMSSTSYDDRYILQVAIELDGAIISNDNYRDLLHENPAFRRIIENRVIGYAWCNDIFILPKDPYGQNGPKLVEILNR